jgi:hypothetical protein
MYDIPVLCMLIMIHLMMLYEDMTMYYTQIRYASLSGAKQLNCVNLSEYRPTHPPSSVQSSYVLSLPLSVSTRYDSYSWQWSWCTCDQIDDDDASMILWCMCSIISSKYILCTHINNCASLAAFFLICLNTFNCLVTFSFSFSWTDIFFLLLIEYNKLNII